MTLRTRLAVAALGAMLLSACSGIKETRGFVIDDTLASAIQVGVDNKASVAKSMGRPTFAGQFDDNDWYYVSQRTKQIAFLTPKVEEAKIIHVRFDAAGNVVAVDKADEKQIASVNPMKGKTPTLGKKRSLLQEIFGNIGSVTQPGLGQSAPPQ